MRFAAAVVVLSIINVGTAFSFKRNALVMHQGQGQSGDLYNNDKSVRQSPSQRHSGPQSMQNEFRNPLLDITKAFGIIGMGLLTSQVAGRAAPAFAASPDVDFAEVRKDIDAVYKKDANRGPTLVRLSWHSSGTYDKISKTGGSGLGTIRFKEELAHGANAGLNAALEWLVSG
jgi:hypothetical protein